ARVTWPGTTTTPVAAGSSAGSPQRGWRSSTRPSSRRTAGGTVTSCRAAAADPRLPRITSDYLIDQVTVTEAETEGRAAGNGHLAPGGHDGRTTLLEPLAAPTCGMAIGKLELVILTSVPVLIQPA